VWYIFYVVRRNAVQYEEELFDWWVKLGNIDGGRNISKSGIRSYHHLAHTLRSTIVVTASLVRMPTSGSYSQVSDKRSSCSNIK